MCQILRIWYSCTKFWEFDSRVPNFESYIRVPNFENLIAMCRILRIACLRPNSEHARQQNWSTDTTCLSQLTASAQISAAARVTCVTKCLVSESRPRFHCLPSLVFRTSWRHVCLYVYPPARYSVQTAGLGRILMIRCNLTPNFIFQFWF